MGAELAFSNGAGAPYITLGRMTSLPSLSCREVSAADDLAALTHLIRSAYAPHAAGGLRYWATHQSMEDTAKRFASGRGFVGELNGSVVATVTLKRAEPDSQVELLREPHTWSFGQFCRRAGAQRQGLRQANP